MILILLMIRVIISKGFEGAIFIRMPFFEKI